MSRTGDRVGDALDIRTRRVGVEGFVAFGGERSIFFLAAILTPLFSFPSVQAARLVFLMPRAALWALFFWAAEALIYGALMAHEYACTTSRCPLFLIGLGCRFSSLGWYPHSAGGAD